MKSRMRRASSMVVSRRRGATPGIRIVPTIARGAWSGREPPGNAGSVGQGGTSTPSQGLMGGAYSASSDAGAGQSPTSPGPRRVRPKVERKLGHLMFRKHGGRRARIRGRRKVDADFNLLAAAETSHAWRCSACTRKQEDGAWQERDDGPRIPTPPPTSSSHRSTTASYWTRCGQGGGSMPTNDCGQGNRWPRAAGPVGDGTRRHAGERSCP